MTDHDPTVARPDIAGGYGTRAPIGLVYSARFSSPKIHHQHLDGLAIVYVRQSTQHQVMEHRESRERQYGLVDRALSLGWSRDRIQVIDEDQGRSGRGTTHRTGFQRLLTEITMEHVGLVLALEVSRLARSSRDWYHVVELCAPFDTLLADEDGVYDANDTNDRLLLGLKASMYEFETFTMRNRLYRGKLHKAERGELFSVVPSGYVKVPKRGVDHDPDEQVQSVIRLIFAKFEELGTIRSVFRYLLQQNIRIGIRARQGPQFGPLQWRRPSEHILRNLLKNPIYAGTFAFGRRPVDRKQNALGSGKNARQSLPMSQWKILLRDRLPAYITWDQFLANQERLQKNRSLPKSPGTARQGRALLAGLLVCGRCGRCLQTAYRSHGRHHYICVRNQQEEIPRDCHGLPGQPIDEFVAGQVLAALEPAALKLSLRAIDEIHQERDRLHRHWQQRLERARQQSARAERQFQAVEPENRLVGRTLERHWEAALKDQKNIEEEYDRFMNKEPLRLTKGQKDEIAAIACDIPALWSAPETTATDRKEIMRLLIERVVVHVSEFSEYVDTTIHWQGGLATQHEVVRTVQRYEQLRDHNELVESIVQLRSEGKTAQEIATALNERGFRTPRSRGEYNADNIRQLLSRGGLAKDRSSRDLLGPHEQWLGELARQLRLTETKLRDWASRGWVHARKVDSQGSWVVWADAEERKRLRKLNALSKPGVVSYPKELTTRSTKTS